MDYYELLKKAKANLPSAAAAGRFEVPAASVLQSGRQTIIRNFGEIAKAVRRDVKHMAKFMAKELGVPGSIRNGELLLQKKVHPDMVEQRIKEYVKEFVVCQECGKPDTLLTVEGNIAFMKCEACGARRSFKV